MLAALDVTNVLDTLIITIPAIIAALYAGRIHRQIKTPSGRSIGHQVEWAAHTSKANNMLLATANGPTQPADTGALKITDEDPPQVPVDHEPPATAP